MRPARRRARPPPRSAFRSRAERRGLEPIRVHLSEAPAAVAAAQPLAGHVAQKAAVAGPRAASRAAHRLSRGPEKAEARNATRPSGRCPRRDSSIPEPLLQRLRASVAQYEVFERPCRLILDWQVERWRLNRQQELVAAVTAALGTAETDVMALRTPHLDGGDDGGGCGACCTRGGAPGALDCADPAAPAGGGTGAMRATSSSLR